MCILVAVPLVKPTKDTSLKKRMGYWNDREDTVQDEVEKTAAYNPG